MPDLGKYATEVLLSYGVTILLVAGLVWVSWRQSVAAKRRLEALEDE
ncbi:heme exporter protein D [Cognatiyoonia sediminum]|uniref:Heme exporter protein D n=1 Tax=Cognatiyoonia sediminum TaxID=1508389 RepID=A0A1M5MPH4_9RHOB|nr:heme exporter protein CcmD [Cognatiyoonia sediminum]SHG79198.1 heme exporter protein D [Cognatiyoonia sediminum]